MTNPTVNRIFRVVFGSSLIIATMAINSTPLGGFVILPLIAIPVIMSGLSGENLIGELTAKPVDAIKARISIYVAKAFKRNTVAA